MKFSELNLKPELLSSLNKQKFEKPTEVQEKAIPLVQKGVDVIVRSKTGSGKTLAFVLPILNQITTERNIQALILAPTRELAHQIDKEIRKLTGDKIIKTAVLYGGVSINPQIDLLERGVQIVVATPGRILDHVSRRTIDLSHLRYVVLDEADRMLDMGFIDDVEKIMRNTPKTRQTTLFSATMPPEIVKLSSRYMNEPEQLLLQQDEVCVKKIRQVVYGIDRKQKLDFLLKILQDKKVTKTIIFCNTKTWAESLSKILWKRRFRTVSLHSDLSQNKRNRVIMDFNSGKYDILVATDVAARGLHIENVSHVINYDIPRNPKDYVHRIGRTGRADKEGDAITLVTQVDECLLKAVESEIKMFLEVQYVSTDKPVPERKHENRVERHERKHKTPERQDFIKKPHVEEIVVKCHSDCSGDDWGLD